MPLLLSASSPSPLPPRASPLLLRTKLIANLVLVAAAGIPGLLVPDLQIGQPPTWRAQAQAGADGPGP
jgi:hypothetical protein